MNFGFKIILILSLIFTFGRCGNKKSVETATTQTDEQEETNIATLTKEQIQSIGIELGTIEQKQLSSSLKANGVLKVPNQNKAIINSVYPGVIKSLTVQAGNIVKKGQVIATLANPQFIQVQSDYLNVNSRILLAELEVKRQAELNAGNAGALKNLQSAESELRSLRTVRSTLEQQIRLMGISPSRLSNGRLISVLAVTSPISGVVSNVMVKMGSYVDVTTPIAEIVDNSQLHLDLFVYEKDLPHLRNNQTIHFNVTNNPKREYDAQIYSLGSSFEGESKAISVHAMVKGDKTGLIDGMNVTAIISLTRATVPAVPSEAIVTVEGQDYIFVLVNENKESVHNEGVDRLKQKHMDEEDIKEKEVHEEMGLKFERVAVAKGTTDIGYTEITLLKEIPKDAKIVVKGAFFVSAKMTNTEGHGH